MSINLDVDGRPSPLDFEMYVTYACNQLLTDIDMGLQFNKSIIAYPTLTPTTARKTKKTEILSEVDFSRTVVDFDKAKKKKPSTSNATTSSKPEVHLTITTLYDMSGNLLQIRFEKKGLVPRPLLKIIGMILPFHSHVTTICFVGGMAGYTLHELKNFLPALTNITDICLDGIFIPEANYELLLEDPTNIVYLSLARCGINDEVVRRISVRIRNGQASTTLSVLNLACNRITDDGMTHIATALRSNRQLYYLNLSGNKFTDEGSIRLLDVLKKFPLTSDEVTTKRGDCFKYLNGLKVRDDVSEVLDESPKLHKVTSKKSVKSVKSGKVDNVTVADFDHVFANKNIDIIDGAVYSLGNTTLCALNLAYNNLSYITLKKIIETVEYQKALNKRPLGLLRVNIEGNHMPLICKELNYLHDLLDYQVFIMFNDNKTKKSNKDGTPKKKTPK